MPLQDIAKKRLLGNVYHVVVRQKEGKNIFLDEDDKTKFIEIINNKKKNNSLVYAYCLMDDHIHLIINEGEDKISNIMRRINITYSKYFSKKYIDLNMKYSAKSTINTLENNKAILEEVKNIHNEPVFHDMVKKPSEYPWSSYDSYLNIYGGCGAVDVKNVLMLFSQDEYKAVKLFIKYTKDSIFEKEKETKNIVAKEAFRHVK